jgi:hypothetical protein
MLGESERGVKRMGNKISIYAFAIPYSCSSTFRSFRRMDKHFELAMMQLQRHSACASANCSRVLALGNLTLQEAALTLVRARDLDTPALFVRNVLRFSVYGAMGVTCSE